jgi:hypothetical protein
MAKVKFTTVDPDGRLQFHRPEDASEVVVDAKGYATDDPIEIAYLDTHPAVKRAKSGGAGDKED